MGVARADLQFPDNRVLFWVPNVIPPVTPDATRPFSALGRLRSGVTTAHAEAEGTAIARSVARPAVSTALFFGKGGPVVVHARALADDITTPIRPALLVMTVAVTLILLMACANVANLCLSRGIARQRELAIRAAIGGGRGRLVRLVLREGLSVTVFGAGIGLLVSIGLTQFMRAILFGIAPLDGIALAAAPLVLMAIATVACASPAFHAASTDPAVALRVE